MNHTFELNHTERAEYNNNDSATGSPMQSVGRNKSNSLHNVSYARFYPGKLTALMQFAPPSSGNQDVATDPVRCRGNNRFEASSPP